MASASQARATAPGREKRRVTFGTIQIPETAKRLINQALDSTRISSGRLVRQFEDRFAELVDAPAAVAVSSGTDADILALALLKDFGARIGDEVDRKSTRLNSSHRT